MSVAALFHRTRKEIEKNSRRLGSVFYRLIDNIKKMTACLFNSCCGCFRLQLGSTLIGYILLILRLIWLVLNSLDMYNFLVMLSLIDLDKQLSVLFAVILANEAIIIAHVVLVGILLAGIHQKKRSFIRSFYLLSAICYLVDCIVFIFSHCYFTLYVGSAYSLLIFIADIVIKVLTPYFLLVIRSHYYKSLNDRIGIVYDASAEACKQYNA